MKQADDIGLGAIDHSAIVNTVERVATPLGRAAKASRIVRAARSTARAATRNGGITILAAVATHVALASVVARPVSWYWLIIPSLVAAAGVLLAALPRPGGHPGA